MAKVAGSVLITGASSGIGEALAMECSRRGVRNLFLCGRNAERLAAVVKRCEEAGAASVAGKVLDVTDAEAVRAWIEGCDAAAPLEVVFSNAGIGTGSESAENVRRTFATNVGGNLNVVLPVIDIFRRRKDASRRPLFPRWFPAAASWFASSCSCIWKPAVSWPMSRSFWAPPSSAASWSSCFICPSARL